MKALSIVPIVGMLILGSCSSSLYTGAEYDDLYYSGEDQQPVARTDRSANERYIDEDQNNDVYYDNIYAEDTLVSSEYSDAVDYDDQIIINNNNYGSGYDYYNNYSYTGRLRRFHGYFDPYWRDPFYYGYSSPFSYGFGFGYPFYGSYYSPYYYDPFYYDYGYGGFYGRGYYGGYYGGFHSPYYSSYYSPWYGSGYHSDRNSVTYGRRERASNMSTRWNNNLSASGTRRSSAVSSSGGSSGTQRSALSGTRTIPADQPSRSANASQSTRRTVQEPVSRENARSGNATERSSAAARPEYNRTSRSYTPSYNNPRMSTRPSYNNSRASDGASRSRVNTQVRTPNQNSYQNAVRSNPGPVRSNPSGSSVQRRSVSPSSSGTPRYSAPSGGRSSYSSPSYNRSSGGGSVSRSYSSGSSSGGSYSGGSSSGSSSSSSRSSSSGSSGSRR